jgi:hypothetical protein
LTDRRLDAGPETGPGVDSDDFAPGPLLAACHEWRVGAAEPRPTGSLTRGVPTMIIRGARCLEQIPAIKLAP